MAGVDFEGLGNGRQHLLDFAGHDGADFFRRDFLVVAALADGFGDAAGHGDAEIGLDQRVFEFLQGVITQLTLGENVADALAERRGGARQALFEPLPPGFLFRLNL